MKGIRLFTIGGCTVQLNILFAVVLIAAALSGFGDVFFACFAMVLLHELSHGFVARALHYEMREVELLPFGGVVRIAGIETARPRDEGLIALAGPAINLLLAMAIYAGGTLFADMPQWLWFLADVNIALALFNLLPALPLDGGRILRALLCAKLGWVKSTRIASAVGMGAGCVLLGAGIWGITQGVWNMTVLLAGTFLLLSSIKQWRWAAYIPPAQNIQALRGRGVLGVRHLAAYEDAELYSIMARFLPGTYHMISVISHDGREMGSLSENDIRENAARHGASTRCGALFPPKRTLQTRLS